MKKPWQKTVETVVGVVAANVILAFAIAAFVVPHGIITGGATGIALFVTHHIALPLSGTILVVNAVLFLLGAIVLGKKFMITTIASTFLYPACLSVWQAVPGVTDLTDNMMLATVYAGVLLGVGVGLVVRVGASTGGTDILALVLHKWTHVSVAVLMYVVDFAVLGLQITFSKTDEILYGIMMLVIETLVLNRVMLMGQSQIQLLVITEEYEKVRERVLKEVKAGVTMLHVETGYSKEEQKAVLCVIPKRKLYAIKEMIHTVDARAFITISQINEVRGPGFSMERVEAPYSFVPEKDSTGKEEETEKRV